MARRIGGNPAKTRLLRGVGVPILLKQPAAAAPVGGFSSPMLLLPFGFGKSGGGGGGIVVNIFSGRGGGAASPLVG